MEPVEQRLCSRLHGCRHYAGPRLRRVANVRLRRVANVRLQALRRAAAARLEALRRVPAAGAAQAQGGCGCSGSA